MEKHISVAIDGPSGAGKSTLARKLGEKYGLPVIHLDKLWWLPNWVNRPEEEFDALLSAELKKPVWIIDGNYLRTLDERLRYADFCIFLDLPTEECLKNAYERVETYKEKTRPDMTEGCAERIDDEFASWIVNYREKVRPVMLTKLKNSGVPFVILKSREETDAFDFN